MTTVISNYPNCPCCSSSSKSSSKSSSSRSSSSSSLNTLCVDCPRTSYTLTTSGGSDPRFNGVFTLSSGNLTIPPGCFGPACNPTFAPCTFTGATTYTQVIGFPQNCTGVYPAFFSLVLTKSLGVYGWQVRIGMLQNGVTNCVDCLSPRFWNGTSASCTPPAGSLTLQFAGGWGTEPPGSLIIT